MPATQTAPQALSAEQVKAILKEARKHSTRDWCLLLVTFRHALRGQEARTLKLAHIDLENSTIAKLFSKEKFMQGSSAETEKPWPRGQGLWTESNFQKQVNIEHS